MMSAYILEEAMSSKDDVITISSYQEVQDLESAMMTSASLKLEKKSVDGISHMLKRNQQELSFKCVPVAELQTTKEVLVIKRDFRISAEDESSRSDEPAAKQLTNFYEDLRELDVNC
ncbi:WPP domain-associated protein-like [Dorcoceras hygrometricum]|uniref:WPP domain-associated protein-like n=1 Tax=Dorcoceras hygrometricum TaxID=472368 RepID=A0A2Z7B607_9LAMI|nr:WPP domain-associated protein-like [Dorcoceras hygrometricum]